MAAWDGDCTEKHVFLDAIGPLRERTFTPQLIRKAFRERGIYPFCPDIITGPMSEAEWEASPEIQGFNPLGNDARGIIRALSPTQSSSDIDVLVSPRRIRKSIEKVKVFIDASSNAPPTKAKVTRQLDRIQHRALRELDKNILQDSVIETFRTVRATMQVAKSRRQISKVYSMRTGDALARITQRTDEENRQFIRRVKRENNALWGPLTEHETVFTVGASTEGLTRVYYKVERGGLVFPKLMVVT
jgi:hypothetical protein